MCKDTPFSLFPKIFLVQNGGFPKIFLAKNGSSPEIFTFYEERVCFLGKGNSQVCGDFSLAMKNNPYTIIA